jgi:flagellar P-ring protein precursor FlgI
VFEKILKKISLLMLGMLVVSIAQPAMAARIKDIAHVQGVRDNQLMGYGLVVGLDGTGDVGRAELTVQTISSMLSRNNIKIDKRLLQARNVAAVVITADLPPFANSGQRIDVTVSSLGNARSLQGGTLLMTPLKGVDGKVYALAQGALSVGGYGVEGSSGNAQVKNHLNVGRIPNGALIERSVAIDLSSREEVRLNLYSPDFTTSVEMARVISEAFTERQPPEPEPESAPPAEGADASAGAEATPPAPEPIKPPEPFDGIAVAVDASTVRVQIPEKWREHVPQFIAFVERLEVERDSVARVVINERTGTVVLGGKVRVKEVAIAHGNLNVTISTAFNTSQPAPFTVDGNANTVVTPDERVSAVEQPGQLHLIKGGATIADVVSGLNAIGVTPRDLIAILQAMKAAGALDAQIEIQ